MDVKEKIGYLHGDFKIFHLLDDIHTEFSYHYHDFYKIIIFLKGDVTYFIEGKSYQLQPYDIVLVNAGEVHKPMINSTCIYERIIIYISSDFISSYKEANYNLSFCFFKVKNDKSNVLRIPSLIKSKLYQVICELEHSLGDSDYAYELYHKILFLEFMIHLNRAAIHETINYIDNYSNQKIIDIIDYLNSHLDEDITIANLSEAFYMNRYYLMHTFKEETGYTIMQYLTTKRLLLAKELIQNGKSATDACYRCGFKNYSTFSRAYRKMFHTKPSDLIKTVFP